MHRIFRMALLCILEILQILGILIPKGSNLRVLAYRQ
jgi:hypothetical protein